MTTISDRCTSACLTGPCDCAPSINDFLQKNRVFHIPLMMKDGSSPTQTERTTLAMMTDAEKATMRSSVRGMPLADAVKLPIYDDVRGLWNSDMPAENLAAIYDGAVVGERAISDEEHRAQARRDHFIDGLRSKGQGAINDNRAPQFARDGRPLSQLAPHERAREEMIIEQTKN